MNHITWFSSTKNQKWQEKLYNNIKPTEIDSHTAQSGYDQTIDGFGGCFNELGQIAMEYLSQEKRNELLDLLFSPDADGLRLNYCRLPIGASDYAAEWYSCNETEGDYAMEHFTIERDKKYLIPYIKEALRRNPDITLFASPWSPPTWMKWPKAYNFGNLIWTEENLTAYALYFAKFVESYQQEGITIHQIHPQNEPVSSQKFPSCIWKGEEFAEFIGKYLGKMFEARNVQAEIWLGTMNSPEVDGERMLNTRYHDYANLVLHDKDAYKYTKGVAYQWAGKYAIADTHKAFPEIKVIQSENECGDGKNTWEYARYIDELFHHYLSNGANAYVYWNMALLPKGMSTWSWQQNSMVTITQDGEYHLNHEYYMMKHYSRFVQKGAKRIELSGPWNATSVAFENPDQSVVLVTFNPFNRPMNVEVTLKGQTSYFTLDADSVNTMVLA